jgi:hypothetical protein
MFKVALRYSARPTISDVGAMNNACPFCGSLKWPKEKMNCCGNGDIQLAPADIIPPALAATIYSPTVMSSIRAYNMSMAMASVGHQNKSLPDGMFVLGGRTYHRIGSMIPANSTHAFAQIYVLDVEQATDRRLAIFNDLNRAVLQQLHAAMIECNPLIRRFVQAARSDVPHLVWHCNDDVSTMQIGAIVAEPGSKRDIVIQRVSGDLIFIDDGHALYHPLAYPLLFPTGSPGWHDRRRVCSVDLSRERCITLTEWGRYTLMHNGSPSHLQRCGKLALEFYCDIWAQVESRNAQFHRSEQQQAKYRAARVAAVEDQLSAGVPASEIGTPVIRLPSSFVGSARYYQQLYMDAMALPKKFGKPDLFVTFTCNPSWPEIAAAIPAGSHWKFHPDIVSRVFMLKLRSLLDDIAKKHIFGKVCAFVYRIEWQARGLPHAHILVILKDKVLSSRHIDAVVSAEIPDPAADPELHELVTKHMLHPECDVDTTHSCRRDDQNRVIDCHRRFPKAMSRETVIIQDGYPQYMRRGRFQTRRKNGHVVTDNWVVSYNKCVTINILRLHCGHALAGFYCCDIELTVMWKYALISDALSTFTNTHSKHLTALW